MHTAVDLGKLVVTVKKVFVFQLRYNEKTSFFLISNRNRMLIQMRPEIY